jgi:NifU-like protein
MIAAADFLCETVSERHLSELQGLDDDVLQNAIAAELGSHDENRRHCIDTCISALHAAFADHRERLIDEFSGEKAIICTCFGVSEETIEHHIASGSLTTVAEVTELSNAGSGCGSCRMLIQEMLDLADRESIFTPKKSV